MARKSLLFGLVLSSVLLSVTVLAGPTYSVQVDTGIDTPDKTVTLENSEFLVTGIAEVKHGNSFPVSVTAPDGEFYRVYVYNQDREIVDQQPKSSDDSLTFSTEDYPTGSYLLALHASNDYQAIYPFVVKGASISLSAPKSVSSGEDLFVTADVAPSTENVTIAGVEFILFQNDTTKRQSVMDSGDTYSATYSTDNLSPGEYSLYAVVKNDSVGSNGNHELIAVSTAQTVTIADQTTTSTTSSATGSGGGTTTASTTTSPVSSTSTHTPSTSPSTTTTTSRPSATTSIVPTSTDSPTSAPSTITPTKTSSTTERSVITPNSSTTTTSSTNTTTPVFPLNILGAGAVLVVIARLLATRER